MFEGYDFSKINARALRVTAVWKRSEKRPGIAAGPYTF
jgi:hypothetical protein